MRTPQEILSKDFGFRHFRPNQQEIINAVVAGKDTFALLPTGGGKSVCYQVPALMKEGLTLVITPLVSLMIDQVEALKAKGIKAVAIHAGLTYRQVEVALDNAAFGDTKIMFCAPERLDSPVFRKRLEQFNVNLIAIDEAHCVSEWGHDFRPSYLKIKEIRDILPGIPMLALTATATPRVEKEITELLGLVSPQVFKASFLRNNLSLAIRQVEDKEAKLIDILEHVKGSAIIYVRSRKKARELSQWLTLKQGVSSTYYHAGLNSTSRLERQKMWKKNRHRVMVATNAFGMGIDKPDVRLVVHYDVPPSLEAYYQEAGRAGRDGELAYAVLLIHTMDKKLLRDRFATAHPEIKYLKQIYQSLANYFQLATGSAKGQSFDFDLTDFCERYKLKPLNAYQALKRLEEEELISLSEALQMPSTLKIKISHEDLYEFQVANASFDHFIKGVLRLYGGQLFTDFIKVEELKMAKFLNMSIDEVVKLLNRLVKLEVLEYTPKTDHPKVTFVSERKNTKVILQDTKRLNDLKQADEDRLASVLDYINEADQCRMVQILAYFGEQGEDCGKCDYCVDKKKDKVDYLKEIKLRLAEETLNFKAIMTYFSMNQEAEVKDSLRKMLDAEIIVKENGMFKLK